MIEGKCLVKCTDGKSRVAGICTTPPPDKKGYCIKNGNYSILKTENTPGWQTGEPCWGVDGNKHSWEDSYSCFGATTNELCNKIFIGPDGNVTF